MVITAVVAAVAVFISGGLLLRLLHITTGAVAVAGGIILALIAVKMALGSEEVVEDLERRPTPTSSRAIRWRSRTCSIRSASRS
jgi:multiple antibiotic resistance protein